MRIVDVSPVVVGAEMRNWIFVKVTTDEGVVGWGEATTEWRTRSVVGALEDFAELVVGQDPFRIEFIWQSLYRQQFWKGGVISMSALSGIDQALHDIKAQALGVPIYELLGGRVRDTFRLYDHLGGGRPDSVYGAVDPEAFRDAALASRAEGYTALKILAVPVSGPLAAGQDLRLAEAAISAVRDAVGDDHEIMVDLHGRTTPAAAIAFARALEPSRPWFLEEPCPPEDEGQLAQIAAHTNVALATGERLYGRSEFLRVLQTRAVGVIQPDICHAGGPSELRRIAALGETFGIGVAPHNPAGPIATLHNLHFAAATPNWMIQEQMRNAAPWFDEILTSPIRIQDGQALLPEGPGLGSAVNETVAAAHPYQPEKQIRAILADGSVADW